MQRDLLKSRLSNAKTQVDIDLSHDEADELHDTFESTSSNQFAAPRRHSARDRSRDYSPMSGAEYFSTALEVDLPISDDITATLRVYYTPPSVQSQGERDTVFVCVHGAGHCAFSWALCAKQLVERSRGTIGALAYDARGHVAHLVSSPAAGKTRLTTKQGQLASEAGLDMSLRAMVNDLVSLLTQLYPTRDRAPAFVLVGHSMGGAVVAEACSRIQQHVGPVTGLCVVDVVEALAQPGSALEALSSMNSIITAQPKSFASVESAIQWHIKSKTLHNLESARVSVPALLRPTEEGVGGNAANLSWRADLAATEPFWQGWFEGLSSKFLSARTARLLLLAGADRLDKELMIGQMQGKYQLEVFPDTGHSVQEDAPDKTADVLLSFWRRNDRNDVLKGVKKVGEL
ncbi:Protein phosphatase methylesterase 1 [Microbotryomycetes sp. JL221]|nr:Protein phosphatase methylesterase 1 [Microbotryomycetes sp. JL221]